MGNSAPVVPGSQVTFPPAVPGKQRICVIGFTFSHHTGRARQIADLISQIHPGKWDTWYRFSGGDEYRGPQNGLLTHLQSQMPDGHPLKTHRTSPFVWIESSEQLDGGYKPEGRDVFLLPLGGRDKFCEWVHKQPDFQTDERIKAIATDPSFTDAWVNVTPGTTQQPK